MARASSQYVCQDCGTVHARWVGKCTSCEAWNSLIEEAGLTALGVPGAAKSAARGKPVELEALTGTMDEAQRMVCGIGELDRVTGGGFVPGSVILIGGEPGIGKSTLLLQVASALANTGSTAIYFSGEEATAQIRLRAKRLGLENAPVAIAAETNLANILATMRKGKTPDLVIIDSVQTLWSEGLESAPGTVSQLRATTQSLIRFAKSRGAAVLLVGHVTKDGQIAGPKVIEHMVDTVLYFEGDRGHPFRILRAIKNRFGPTDEIGVFEMAEKGLREVENPSELFLGERDNPSPGAAVFAGIEGTRPILVEIQALVAPSSLGTPRRAVIGWEPNRLSMLLAVLEARTGLVLGSHDVYLNVAGGLKITEPAADLAATAALVSSFSGCALPSDRVYFGEISLSGAVRASAHMTSRLKEAQKLGFKSAVIPTQGEYDGAALGLEVVRIGELKPFVTQLIASASPVDR